ncbi:putative siderophore transport system permease protein YfhA [compost metagenome]
MGTSITIRNRGLSWLIAKKTLVVIISLIILDLILGIISTGIGSTFIHPIDVLKVLFGGGDSSHQMIVEKLRLPRIVTAILVGASLGVAGGILQGIVRNPLTSPELVGITGGATLGAVCFILFLAGSVSIAWMPLSAILGAVIISLLVYILAWRNGVTPMRLVLIGIGISTALGALTYMIILMGPLALQARSLIFMTGSVYGVSWTKDVLVLLPWVGILIPASFIVARHLNVQELGDDIATSVGSSVQRKRLLLLVTSVALAGAAVAIGGAIGFIGLMAPHIARKLVGPAFGGVLPVSALIGAFILMISDLIARTAFSPLDIPAGVFTAAIGAPFFLYLLYRQQK